jgi:hypothetical protein
MGGEFLNRVHCLLGVAGNAGRNPVAYSVRPAPRPQDGIVQIERHVSDAAIDAVPSELVEGVFLDRVADARLLLILDA